MLLSAATRKLSGTVPLDGSKSISNRALIILALTGADPEQYLTHLSTSKDTTTLLRLLASEKNTDTFDAGDAGTVFRFMAAYLATKPGRQVLTGSARMLERPIKGLVDGLRQLGADISYLGQEGYPPLAIDYNPDLGKGIRELPVDAGTSSQFLSALLMIAPYLPEGLTLIPTGRLVSRPYLDLTLSVMRHFGAEATWEGDRLLVAPGRYSARSFRVEADWSAASYWYSLAALSDSTTLKLEGLFAQSGQGDSVLADMMTRFGVTTTFESDGITITKPADAIPAPVFEWDFLECPDIAQTLAVTCAGLGVQGLFTGLETLSIKETDRVAALRNELAKVQVSFSKLPPRFSSKSPDKIFYLVDGKAAFNDTPPEFDTYGDHRMAMAFAPLFLLAPIRINEPEVVKKSYPQFWRHLDFLMS